MNQSDIKALADKDLPQIIIWVNEELAARKEKRQQDAKAQIMALASSAELSVSFNARVKRGRPSQKLKVEMRKRRS